MSGSSVLSLHPDLLYLISVAPTSLSPGRLTSKTVLLFPVPLGAFLDTVELVRCLFHQGGEEV